MSSAPGNVAPPATAADPVEHPLAEHDPWYELHGEEDVSALLEQAKRPRRDA